MGHVWAKIVGQVLSQPPCVGPHGDVMDGDGFSMVDTILAMATPLRMGTFHHQGRVHPLALFWVMRQPVSIG
jgi:hypothetical protein